jgi:hypothetical protein
MNGRRRLAAPAGRSRQATALSHLRGNFRQCGILSFGNELIHLRNCVNLRVRRSARPAPNLLPNAPVRTQTPHAHQLTARRGPDREQRLPSVDAKSEEAFRIVATLYQALVSAESSERSLREITNPELVEFFRSVQKQQLGIAQKARSMLVEMREVDHDVAASGRRVRFAG